MSITGQLGFFALSLLVLHAAGQPSSGVFLVTMKEGKRAWHIHTVLTNTKENNHPSFHQSKQITWLHLTSTGSRSEINVCLRIELEFSNSSSFSHSFPPSTPLLFLFLSLHPTFEWYTIYLCVII